MGAFRPPAHRAKAGRTVSDGRVGAADSLACLPHGKVFHLLAAGCRALSVVSFLSAHAVCPAAFAAGRHVPRQAGCISPAGMDGGAVADFRRAVFRCAHKRSASACVHFSRGCRRMVGQKPRLRHDVFCRHRLAGTVCGGGTCRHAVQVSAEKRQAPPVAGSAAYGISR